ncbi:MAG: hypothetical protein K2I81_04585 [Alphaproteobacteria bacterium]|nr:hypothetical protein [Alphaproteobacteria bacterium]
MSAYFETMWSSIDFIAKIKKSSCSRLAINGRLDPTTFNKSKRYTKYGQEHWLSFGSIVSTLHGTNMTMVDFAVIYQILHMFPRFSEPEQMQEIINDIKNRLQSHMDTISQHSQAT